MNNRSLSYLRLQYKRAKKLLPGILALFLAFFAVITVVAVVLYSKRDEKDSKVRYRIGIMGETDSSFVEFGIKAVENLDDIGTALEFIQFADEKEAARAIDDNEISVYIFIPDGFIDSVECGRNDIKLICVAHERNRDSIQAVVIRELLYSASTFLTASQCSIFSLQEVMEKSGITGSFWEITDDINLRLLLDIVSRSEFLKVKNIGISGAEGIEEYYFCAVIVIMLSLFSLAANTFFVKKGEGLERQLKFGGVGTFGQVLTEYFSYFCVSFLCLLAVWMTALAIVKSGINKPLLGIFPDRLFSADFFWALVGAVMIISAFQFALYEICGAGIGGMMIQFVLAVFTCFISGTFYPISFLPDIFDTLGTFLPAGIGMRFLLYSGTEGPSGLTVAAFFGILLLCFGASLYGRNKHMERA